MKLSVDTKQLLSALHRLSLVVPKGAAAKIGVMGCVKLANDGFGGLSAAGTDGHAVGRADMEVECDFEDAGTILPDFARLLAVVESCPGAVVSLSTSKAGKLEVRSGAFRASLGLSEPDLYPTLPEMPPAAPLFAPALFPALARAISMGGEKEGDREGALWEIEADLVSVVAATPHLGSLEEFGLAGAERRWPDVDPERLLPRDWAILKAWSGIGALSGATPIEHGADDRFTFWAGPDWQLWFIKIESRMLLSMAAYRKGFSGGAGQEISTEAITAIRQGFEAVSGAVINGRDAVTSLVGDSDGFSVQTRGDNTAAWVDETPLSIDVDWSAGSAENLLKALAVLGEKEGPIMLSMSPKGDGLRLERGGLVCLVAGFK